MKSEATQSLGELGLLPFRRRWLLPLAVVVVAWLSLTGVADYHVATSPSNLLGFGTIDGTDKSYFVYDEPCADGIHSAPFYTLWAIQKALEVK